MPAPDHVVLWDPSGEYWEGAIVPSEEAPKLLDEGVALIPVERELVKRSAVGGYSKRAWGTGWPLDTSMPRIVCPLVLYAAHVDNRGLSAERFHRLHLCARLVPDSQQAYAHAQEGGRFVGTLRPTHDTSQPGTSAGGISEPTIVDVGALPKIDSEGGWTVYFSAWFAAAGDGYVALCLYGSAPGLRVAWAAVSQSR